MNKRRRCQGDALQKNSSAICFQIKNSRFVREAGCVILLTAVLWSRNIVLQEASVRLKYIISRSLFQVCKVMVTSLINYFVLKISSLFILLSTRFLCHIPSLTCSGCDFQLTAIYPSSCLKNLKISYKMTGIIIFSTLDIHFVITHFIFQQ